MWTGSRLDDFKLIEICAPPLSFGVFRPLPLRIHQFADGPPSLRFLLQFPPEYEEGEGGRERRERRNRIPRFAQPSNFVSTAFFN